MENSKNYTVMELAELLGVPRTTINDWLSRYGQYILSIPQGKRKVYPESALIVLREIASLRNQALSFVQIEKALGEKYPIKAEFVSPAADNPAENREKDLSSAPVEKETAVPMERKDSSAENEFALIARRQSEEITRMISDSFCHMDERIRELEGIARIRKKMSCFWFGAFLVFLLLLGAVAFGAWHFLEKGARERENLIRKQEKKNRTIAALREQSVTLIAESKSFRTNAARLEKELQKQKKEFELSIQTQRRDLQALHAARVQSLDARWKQSQAQVRESQIRQALEKERFASERLELLRKMDLLKKQLEAEKKRSVAEKAQKVKKTPAGKKGAQALKAQTPPAKKEKVQASKSKVQSPSADRKNLPAPAGK